MDGAERAKPRPEGVRQDAEHRKATPLGDVTKKTYTCLMSEELLYQLAISAVPK